MKRTFLRKSFIKNLKSFLDLKKEKEERFKALHETPIGDECKRIAFENMHFMEDKQWINKKFLDSLVTELKKMAKWRTEETMSTEKSGEVEVTRFRPRQYVRLDVLLAKLEAENPTGDKQ